MAVGCNEVMECNVPQGRAMVAAGGSISNEQARRIEWLETRVWVSRRDAKEAQKELDQARQEVRDGSPVLISRPFFGIRFQCGPVAEHGINGTTIEEILDVVLERLRGFQAGPFHCRENALAITNIEQGRCGSRRGRGSARSRAWKARTRPTASLKDAS